MINPVNNNNKTVINGRSPQADAIYQQYLAYYNNINTQITAINQLPANVINHTAAAQDVAQLVALQQQLYPIYTAQYNNGNATLSTFQSACSSIVSQATTIYNTAINTPSASSSSSSPINVFTANSGSSGSTSGSTSSTSSTTAVKSTGRSPDAAAIYSQYLKYYNDINTQVTAINQLPYARVTQANVVQDKQQLVALQQQLYPIYNSQYNDSTKTLATFNAACASIMAQATQAYNDAIAAPASTGNTGTTTPPSTSGSNTGSSTSTSGTGSTGSTSGTTGTTGTTPVTPVTPVTSGSSSAGTIENGTWYIDWTSRDTPIPQGVNSVNIFVGNMSLDANGNPTVGNFGALSQNQVQMDAFIQACKAKGMTVKISLGGGGGSYDNTWDVLTQNNVQSFAQTLVNYCNTHGLNGVDFDCEEFTSATDRPAQQALVGTLIKDCKLLNPNFQTSLDTNAGFGPNFPWQGIVQNIMNAAVYTNPTTSKQTSGVDRVNIMAYFNSLSDEKGWVTGWANWLQSTYNFKPSQVGVGMFPGAGAYDPTAFAAWAAQQGYSTYIWNYDPANPTQSDKTTTGVLNAYNAAKVA